MHEGDKYNGKLLTTMQITSISVGLKLSFKIDGPVNVSHDPTVVRDGIMKDILDLRSMVRTAGRRFRQNQYPPVWNLFLHHNYNPQHFCPRTMRDIKKVALFNYTHLVFFDSVSMAKFIFKIHEIRKKNDRDFDRHVRLNFHPVDMRGWERRILLNAHLPDYDPHQSPLRHVLYYRNNSTAPTPPLQIRFRYPPPYGVTPYLRIVLAHCDDHQPQAIWLGRNIENLVMHSVLSFIGKVNVSPNTYLLHQELLNFMLVAMSTQLLSGPSPGHKDIHPFTDMAMVQECSFVGLVVRKLLLNYIM
ncbi:hypothetical protein LOK49_LG02G00298 [Camellia lanceoleosa]|uniref:Uncharacterized protein n=1 Tax=Camellia lanceoleosa TaxID=1840588 RepID=A0ACC0IML5_9ERIC|nr:hypothetical protein LOK49_LG02G00298 [Camellia lanceoleosa]